VKPVIALSKKQPPIDPAKEQSNFARAFYDTAANAGIEVLPFEKCCQLLCCLYVWGGGQEVFVLNGKLNRHCMYAAKRYHLQGGEVPDVKAVARIQELMRECGGEKRMCNSKQAPRIPVWALQLAQEYGFTCGGSVTLKQKPEERL